MSSLVVVVINALLILPLVVSLAVNVAEKDVNNAPVSTTVAPGLPTDSVLTKSIPASHSEIDFCKSVCDKTYALHTYPQADNLAACHRGCRFYELIATLADVQTDGEVKNNNDPATKNACLTACSESYKNESENYACSLGCNSQVSSQSKKEEKKAGSEESKVADVRVSGPLDAVNETKNTDEVAKSEDENLLSDQQPMFVQSLPSPFLLMKSLLNSIMDRGSVLVQRSSFSFIINRQSDGENSETRVVVVQSEPEVVVHQYPDMVPSFDSPDVEYNAQVGERTTADYKNQPRLDVSLWTNDSPFIGNGPNLNQPSSSEGKSWISCFGYNSGVPRWLLASVLFLAIFALAWICCATTATAPEQHIRRQIGLGSDLQYLRLHDEPCKLVIEDQKSMMVLDGSNDEKPPSYDDVQEGQLLEKPKEAPVEGATSA